MGSSVYVASVEGFTGKSTVALGVLEQFSRRVERVGVFRPIVRADAIGERGRDYVLELLTAHEAVSLSYDECAGVSNDDVHADPVAALDRIGALILAAANQSCRRDRNIFSGVGKSNGLFHCLLRPPCRPLPTTGTPPARQRWPLAQAAPAAWRGTAGFGAAGGAVKR